MRFQYPGRIGIWSVGFYGVRKTGEPELKPSEQTENKLKPYMALGLNRTQATLVGGERSRHCTNPTPLNIFSVISMAAFFKCPFSSSVTARN